MKNVIVNNNFEDIELVGGKAYNLNILRNNTQAPKNKSCLIKTMLSLLNSFYTYSLPVATS